MARRDTRGRNQLAKTELSEIVPVETIETLLGQESRVGRLRTADLDEILATQPSDLYGIAASTWNRIVWQGSARVDPMQMRSYFQHEDPRLALAIEKVIGKPMIKEFGFLEATITHARKPFVVATSSVAHLFSDELHLYDIALADPRHPLPRPARKSATQHHRGFGLLADVMRNLFAAARERKCSTITLTAASRPLVAVFARYGFAVEDNSFARQALEFGVGIPMEARLT